MTGEEGVDESRAALHATWLEQQDKVRQEETPGKQTGTLQGAALERGPPVRRPLGGGFATPLHKNASGLPWTAAMAVFAQSRAGSGVPP